MVSRCHQPCVYKIESLHTSGVSIFLKRLNAGAACESSAIRLIVATSAYYACLEFHAGILPLAVNDTLSIRAGLKVC